MVGVLSIHMAVGWSSSIVAESNYLSQSGGGNKVIWPLAGVLSANL